MTFLEATIKILTENGNQPLSSREIWYKISEKYSIKSKSKKPWISLNTILLHHSKPEYNKTIYFNIVSDNPVKFVIKDLNENIEIAEEVNDTTERKELYSVTSSDIGWRKLTVYDNKGIIEYELSDCSEYTYVIEDELNSTIKIGKSQNDPTERFNQLKKSNSSIKLSHVFPAEKWSVDDLSNKFKDFQKGSGWVYYTLELRNFLKDEVGKHSKVMGSFNLKNKLMSLEKKMLEII